MELPVDKKERIQFLLNQSYKIRYEDYEAPLNPTQRLLISYVDYLNDPMSFYRENRIEKDDYIYAPEFWIERKKTQALIDRGNVICPVCGGLINMFEWSFHHIDGDKENNNPMNLIAVHTDHCHGRLHGGPENRSYWQEILTSIKYGAFVSTNERIAESFTAGGNY